MAVTAHPCIGIRSRPAVQKSLGHDLEEESGFYWLPFDKLELQIYNIRHLQQHTGELCERLGARGDVEVDWVGMKPAS